MFFQNEPVPVIEPADLLDRGEDYWYWNLWKTRQFPYNRLELGDLVVAVVTPKQGPSHWLLTGVVEIVELVKEPYTSLDEAAKLLDHEFRVAPADFLTHPYTVAAHRRGAVQGVLLGLHGICRMPLNVPRPPELPRLRPNGWLEIEDLAACRLLGISPSSIGLHSS